MKSWNTISRVTALFSSKTLPDELDASVDHLPERISDVIDRWVERSQDHPALIESSGAWTYRELATAISEAKQWLRDLGARPGDRVMLVFENCRAFVAILLACASLDVWPVLVSTHLSGRELDEIGDHCGPRRVIYFTTASRQARDHAKRRSADVVDAGSLGSLEVGPLNSDVEQEPTDSKVSERVAALIYTSGTTGLPKGVMLTHRNLLFVASLSAKIRGLTREDRMYGLLPMSHAVGLSVVLLGSLISGATLYLSPRFDPFSAITTIEKERLTVLLGAPSLFSMLLEYAKLRGLKSLRFPALRIISSSGAPLQPILKSQVEELFGLTLYNGYGVTECSPNISQAVVGEHRTDTSVGRPLPGIELQLVGADQKPVAAGAVGELWVRGPNVMKGYYRAPEETAAALNSDGWFNTRDLARLKDGYLFIEGRTKELIIRFGLNVYPAEVEAVLNSHPAVARSAVLGRTVAGTAGGEEVIAFIQPKRESTVQEAEIALYAAQHLAPYKRPSHILIVPDMPITATGKVVKGELSKLPQFARLARSTPVNRS